MLRDFPQCVELTSSLPCLQEPTTCSSAEPDEFSLQYPTLNCTVYFNSVPSFMPVSSQWPPYSAFLSNILYVFLFSTYVLHSLPVSSFLMLFWCGVKSLEVLTHFYPVSYYLLSLRPIYHNFLSILFWNSLRQCFSVHRRDELLKNYFDSDCCACKAEWCASTRIFCILLPVCCM